MNVEVWGVPPEHWTRDNPEDAARVIIDAERLGRTGEDPYELARYLSSGYDDGAPLYGPAAGGHTEVRETRTGEVLERFYGGQGEGQPDAGTSCALLIGTLVDAAYQAGKIGDADLLVAFEVAADAARKAGPPGGYERLAEIARYFVPNPSAVVAAIRAYPVQSDERSLIEEAMTFDRNVEDVGLDEARAIRDATRRTWEARTTVGLPPVPPMIPEPEGCPGPDPIEQVAGSPLTQVAAPPITATPGPDGGLIAAPGIGVPYAKADPDTGERICPACGDRIAEAHGPDGEALTANYAHHYLSKHVTG